MRCEVKPNTLLLVLGFVGCLVLLPVSIAQAGCGGCGGHAQGSEAKAVKGTSSCGGKVCGSEAKAAEGCCGSCNHARGTQAKAASGESVAKKEVAKKIERYIKEDKKAKGGYFLLYDEKNDKPLALTLKGVHKDMVMNSGEGEYFACADFFDPGGKVYDVDILVKRAGDRGLEVSEVSIHKEGDEHRYKWHKTEHGMEKQPVGHADAEEKEARGKS